MYPNAQALALQIVHQPKGDRKIRLYSVLHSQLGLLWLVCTIRLHSSFEFLPQLLILDFENPPTEAWYVTDIKSTKVYILTLLYPFPNLQIYKPFLPGLPLKKCRCFYSRYAVIVT